MSCVSLFGLLGFRTVSDMLSSWHGNFGRGDINEHVILVCFLNAFGCLEIDGVEHDFLKVKASQPPLPFFSFQLSSVICCIFLS